jgi:hypothetical protein
MEREREMSYKTRAKRVRKEKRRNKKIGRGKIQINQCRKEE